MVCSIQVYYAVDKQQAYNVLEELVIVIMLSIAGGESQQVVARRGCPL